MQATNKGDATQVYEGASRATEKGIKGFVKGSIKYVLKPFFIFSYRYFIEGIKAVQNDGPTKELEKITNLSYNETIQVMEKCQKDGVRVVASERKILDRDNEFGKEKSLFQQKRITKYAREIRKISYFKAKHPKISKLLNLDERINKLNALQKSKIEEHENKTYNIYFNKSRAGYMGNRIAELIELRTGINKDSIDSETQDLIQKFKEKDQEMNFDLEKDLLDKLKMREQGEVDIDNFKKNYCIHKIPISSFNNIKDELDSVQIPYGVNTPRRNKEKIINLYFETKHLNQYSELGFNKYGQLYMYGNDNKKIRWNRLSQDKVISFKTAGGKQEKETYSKLADKSYTMKKNNNDECVWTVLKDDLKEIREREKKRNVVSEEVEFLKILDDLEQQIDSSNISKELQEDLEDEVIKEK